MPDYEGMAFREVEPTLPFWEEKESSYQGMTFGEVGEKEDDPSLPELSLEDPEERAFARAHPNTWAAGKAFLDLTGLPRYLFSSSREELQHLDGAEKAKALLWDTLDTALIVAGGPIIKGTFKAGKWATMQTAGRLAKKVRIKTMRPVEDLALKGVKPFAPDEAMTKILKAMKFKEDDIYEILQDRTKAVVSGRLSESLARKIEPSLLETRHYRGEYRRILKSEVGEKISDETMESVFKAHVKKRFDQKVSFKEASPGLVANVIEDLVTHPKVARRLVNPNTSWVWFQSWTPTRIVFGQADKVYGTFEKIYLRTTEAAKQATAASFHNTFVWFDMLEQRGLGIVKKLRYGERRLKPAFSSRQADEAFVLINKADELMNVAARAGGEAVREAQITIQGLASKKSPMIRKLVQAWENFSDFLYAEHSVIKIPQLFRKARLTPEGEGAFSMMFAELRPQILEIFSTGAKLTHGEKLDKFKEILRRLRKTRGLGKEGKHPWFFAEGDDLTLLLNGLSKDLTIGKGGKYIDYLENYTARIGAEGSRKASSWSSALVKPSAFYTKKRKLAIPKEQTTNFGAMIEGRINAQSKELYLYPELEGVVGFAKTLPYNLRSYTDHFIARALNRPSEWDYKLALVLEATIGKIEGVFGRAGKWDDRRTVNLAMTINNFTYMGGLGLKPFSAIRNLFQPLMMVPADLGGFKDLQHLVKGAHRAFFGKVGGKSTRQYLSDIGAIQEFAPELYMKVRALPFGPTLSVRGKDLQLPHIEQIRDFTMWMFKGSDRWNRYVTGGAALEKWDGALRSIGGIQALKTKAGMEKFIKKSGIRGRHSWIRERLQQDLRLGRVDNAKDAFVLDVIADTQFLYGPLESPILSQKYGALGKTGMIFQTFWMNYGTSLEKWARTGTAGERLQRITTAMMSAAIAEQLMEPVFGRRTALATVAMGPFPTFDASTFPPAWTPLWHATRGVLAAGQIPFGGDPKAATRQVKAIFRSLPIFVPGGLQAMQFQRGFKKEGWEGLPGAIIKYKRDVGYEPLWGIGQ